MSLKEKIQRLFKKKTIEPFLTSSINGIYTAKSSDVKELAKQVNHIQDTLDNLQIPVIPPHDDFATKSMDNTFTATNTFTKAIKCETFPEISRGNFEPSLNKQLTPKYYVDKKVNDNISGLDTKFTMLNTTTNTKIDNAVNTLNANITTATDGALRDSKTYTDEKHGEQQTQINHLNDITGKITQRNTWEEPNTFNKGIQFPNNKFINVNGEGKLTHLWLDYDNNPVDTQAITKKYLDDRLANIGGGGAAGQWFKKTGNSGTSNRNVIMDALMFDNKYFYDIKVIYNYQWTNNFKYSIDSSGSGVLSFTEHVNNVPYTIYWKKGDRLP